MFKFVRHLISKTTTTRARLMVDALEDRRLLSTSVLHDAPLPLTTASVPVSAATGLDLRGTYRGTVKLKGLPQSIPFSLVVTRQTTRAIKGTVSAAKAPAMPFSGAVKNGNTISGTFTQDNITGTFSFKVSVTGKGSGTLSLTLNGQTITGTIAMNRV